MLDTNHYSPGDTGGGTVHINADADTNWDYGYGYRNVYGFEETEGWGYYYFGDYGYGYGSGPTSITYTGDWTSPSAWPAGNYEIQVKIIADGKTFTKTSAPFTLQRQPISGPEGGEEGAADLMPPEISDVQLCTGVAVTRITADICWRTDEAGESGVEFWSSPSRFTLDTRLVYYHHVQLTGLSSATTYYYRVMSRDAHDNEAWSGVYTFTTPGVPATFTLSSLSVSPAEVDIGEEVTITVLVTNTGEGTGSYEMTLKIDNEVVDTEEVTLAGGNTETVTFTITTEDARTYTVAVDGLAGTFLVREGPSPPPSATPPVTPPAKKINWWLIGGIIAAVVAVTVNVWRLYQRRRA